MKTLKIDETKARKLYNDASLLKSMLEEEFGKDILSPNMMDRLKTVDDILTELGHDPKTFIDDCKKKGDTRDEIAYKIIKMLTKLLNDGWKADWSDHNQYKYIPYFEANKNKAGFGFSDAGYGYWDACATFGSRLCYKDRERAEFAGKQFTELYKDLII